MESPRSKLSASWICWPKFLEATELTFTQYLDIFKGFTLAVRNVVNNYGDNFHGENMGQIESQIHREEIVAQIPHVNGTIDHEKLKHRVSEIFFRDRIAFSLGFSAA